VELLTGEWHRVVQAWQDNGRNIQHLARRRVKLMTDLWQYASSYEQTDLAQWIGAHLPVLAVDSGMVCGTTTAPHPLCTVHAHPVPCGTRKEYMHDLFLACPRSTQTIIMKRALPGRCRAREFDKFMQKCTVEYEQLAWFRNTLLCSVLGIFASTRGEAPPQLELVLSVYRCTRQSEHSVFWTLVDATPCITSDLMLRAVRECVVCMVEDCPALDALARAHLDWHVFVGEMKTRIVRIHTLAPIPSDLRKATSLTAVLAKAVLAAPHSSDQLVTEIERLVSTPSVGLWARVRHKGVCMPLYSRHLSRGQMRLTTVQIITRVDSSTPWTRSCGRSTLTGTQTEPPVI
jgi:hypothetical protein